MNSSQTHYFLTREDGAMDMHITAVPHDSSLGEPVHFILKVRTSQTGPKKDPGKSWVQHYQEGRHGQPVADSPLASNTSESTDTERNPPS